MTTWPNERVSFCSLPLTHMTIKLFMRRICNAFRFPVQPSTEAVSSLSSYCYAGENSSILHANFQRTFAMNCIIKQASPTGNHRLTFECGSKSNHQATAGFSLFHLPGFPKWAPIFDQPFWNLFGSKTGPCGLPCRPPRFFFFAGRALHEQLAAGRERPGSESETRGTSRSKTLALLFRTRARNRHLE